MCVLIIANTKANSSAHALKTSDTIVTTISVFGVRPVEQVNDFYYTHMHTSSPLQDICMFCQVALESVES